MDKQKIGDFIRVKRKEKGLTQVELSEKLGVSDRAVSKWERGICCPDISILKDLCKILDVNINELLSGSELIELSKDESENILVETVKTYTNVEKKKNRTLLIFTIVILIVYTFLVFAMYLTFNQTNKREGMNWDTIQTRKISDELYTILENYDYSGLKRFLVKHTDIVPEYANENENNCYEHYIKDKYGENKLMWGPVCRLKDFEDNGIKFKNHKYYQQFYSGLGNYLVEYKLTISYKNIDTIISVPLGSHNGILNSTGGIGMHSSGPKGTELERNGYSNILNKINSFFIYTGDIFDYMETVDVNHNN